MGFLQELKRRKVVRVALVYAAVAFAVLQAADLIFPLLRLPEWSLGLVLGLELVGLPIALVLAWAFEITPDGIRRTGDEPATPARAGAAPPGARWFSGRTAVAVLLFALAGAGVGWLARGGDAAPQPEAGRSIAVLPFQGRSAAGEDADFFAAGLHDELLTQLSRIADLSVTSRTSVLRYANSDRSIPAIAQELGVAFVLEGGVQRAGDRIRLNAQLIEAVTDRHVWAETYDEAFTVANVFAIQAQIASAIADAMRAELSGETRAELATAPTQDPAAYEAYLRGRARGYWDYTPAASAAFEEAVRRDPRFVAAWAGLARNQAWLAKESFEQLDPVNGRGRATRAREAADRATALAPAALETMLARGYVAYYVDWDFAGALRAFEALRARMPNDARVEQAIGLILRRQGRTDEAVVTLRRALSLDPGNPDPGYDLAETALRLHRYDEAQRAADLTLAMEPAYDEVLFVRAMALVALGDTAAARTLVDRRAPEILITFAMDLWRAAPGDRDELERRMARLRAARDSLPFASYHLEMARLARQLGDGARVRAHADSARRDIEALLIQDFPARVRASLEGGLGIALAHLGRPGEAVEHGMAAVELMPASVDPVSADQPLGDLLEVLALTGGTDEAIPIARRLLDEPSMWSARRLQTDPLLAPLREDSRFRELTARR